MSRIFVLPDNQAAALWNAAYSVPPALSADLAVALKVALTASTDGVAPVLPAAPVVPTLPWGAPSVPFASTPAAPAIGVTFRVDHNGHQVDDVMPRGTPGTVYADVTGHVISIVPPGKGFYDFLTQVQNQVTGGDPVKAKEVADGVAGYAYQASGLMNPATTLATWPLIADMVANRHAYLTPEQQAQEDRNAMQSIDQHRDVPSAPNPRDAVQAADLNADGNAAEAKWEATLTPEQRAALHAHA